MICVLKLNIFFQIRNEKKKIRPLFSYIDDTVSRPSVEYLIRFAPFARNSCLFT